MDSGGNSGSVSSSGDEEYESRTNHQSIPSFLNPSLTNFGSSDPNPPPNTADPSHILSHHHLFDPSPPSSSSTYLQPSNTNFFLNLDTSRSPIVRSDQTYSNNLGLINPHQNHFQTSSSIPLQPQPQQHQQQQQQQQPAPPNPVPGARASKKRTRASRRAPTTVLTTDTSNFRAMVQEFTGIPAPPFSASSPFSRRFDLFGGASGSSSGIGPLYPSLVRPSPIKPPHQNPTNLFGHVASSSLSSSSQIFGNAMVDATSSATAYLHSSDQHNQGLMMMNNKQPMMMMRNMLGMQNHGLNMGFHVQSQSQSHHHLSGDHLNPSAGLNVGSSGFGGAKHSQPNLALDHLNVGLGQTQAGGSGSDGNQNVWRADGATGSATGDMSCNKMNFTVAPETNASEFHGEKGGLENNVSNRGEGTVDSWIFPSD